MYKSYFIAISFINSVSSGLKTIPVGLLGFEKIIAANEGKKFAEPEKPKAPELKAPQK